MRRRARYCPHCGVPAVRTSLPVEPASAATPDLGDHSCQAPAPTPQDGAPDTGMVSNAHRQVVNGAEPMADEYERLQGSREMESDPVMAEDGVQSEGPPVAVSALILLAATLVFLLAWLAMG